MACRTWSNRDRGIPLAAISRCRQTIAMLVNLTFRVPQAMIKGLTKFVRWESSGRPMLAETPLGIGRDRAASISPAPMCASELSLRDLSSSSDLSEAYTQVSDA